MGAFTVIFWFTLAANHVVAAALLARGVQRIPRVSAPHRHVLAWL